MKEQAEMMEQVKKMDGIRFEIAEIMRWGEFDFEIIPSGWKGGRPNWEIQHDEGGPRFAFTAFDGDDIHDLHMVEQ